jgi:hypothetical protein
MMAWSTIDPFEVAAVLTAAQMNALRENQLETAPAKATTAGDTFYATAANTIARLAAGAAGRVLRMNAGATAPEWAVNVPAAAHGRVSSTGVLQAGSHNVASAIRNSAGDYTITFTTAMPDANYTVVVSLRSDDGSLKAIWPSTQGTGSFGVLSFIAAGAADATFSFAVFGT